MVARYAITDPILLTFVRKYESQIPWGELEPARQFKEGRERAQYQLNTIARSMLNGLRGKIDRLSDDNVYVKWVDLESEAMQNNDNPQVAAAIAEYRRNPDAAMRKVLDVVNDGKEESFNSWWEYVTEQYSQQPAFAYMMMKAVIDSSDERTQNPPVPINANAVANTFDSVDGNDFSFIERYSQNAMDTSTKRRSFDEGWVMIPGKPKSNSDPERWGSFGENLETLRMYGVAGGWCIGGHHWSKEYLSDGDFHILIDNGQPVVALRVNNVNNLAEIAGKNNESINIDRHWERTVAFLHKSDLRYENNATYRNLKKKIENNRRWASMTDEQFMNELVEHNSQYDTKSIVASLSSENVDRFHGVVSKRLSDMAREKLNSVPDPDNDIQIFPTRYDRIEPYIKKYVRGKEYKTLMAARIKTDEKPFFAWDPSETKIETPRQAWEAFLDHGSGFGHESAGSAVSQVIDVASFITDFPSKISNSVEIEWGEGMDVLVRIVGSGQYKWGKFSEMLIREMNDDQWKIIAEGAVKNPAIWAHSNDDYLLAGELVKRFGDEMSGRLKEAAELYLYEALDELDRLCDSFLLEYTEYGWQIEEMKYYHDDLDEANIREMAISEIQSDIVSNAVYTGNMHILEYKHYDMSDENLEEGWYNTISKHIGDREFVKTMIDRHGDGICDAGEDMAVKMINSYPDLAPEIVRAIGRSHLDDPITYPAAISAEAIVAIAMDGGIGWLSETVEKDDIIDALERRNQLDKIILDENNAENLPETIETVDEILSDRWWMVPEWAIDKYVNINVSEVGYDAIKRLIETGNPHVIRRLRKILSPSESERYVDQDVDEYMERDIRETEPPQEVPEEQGELFDEEGNRAWATWIERSMIRESGFGPRFFKH